MGRYENLHAFISCVLFRGLFFVFLLRTKAMEIMGREDSGTDVPYWVGAIVC